MKKKIDSAGARGWKIDGTGARVWKIYGLGEEGWRIVGLGDGKEERGWRRDTIGIRGLGRDSVEEVGWRSKWRKDSVGERRWRRSSVNERGPRKERRTIMKERYGRREGWWTVDKEKEDDGKKWSFGDLGEQQGPLPSVVPERSLCSLCLSGGSPRDGS